MSRKKENTGFICERCSEYVYPLNNGSFRNHCPFCLYSKHLDNKPGDRMNQCKGLMKPIGIRNKSGKGMQIIHRCMKCGKEKVNKIAEFDNQPDDIDVIVKLI
ncbi:RNHCP domain-containing protein [Wukongibacter baidiensis]|uniref:RNHCP domain-containing protein n=1 Tax=Wukongibacter baidiensis TaxID=1723361 RepID=UPI003D7F2022